MGKQKEGTAKSRQIRISNFAYQNVDEIVNFIAFQNQQPINAAKVNEAIENTIAKIAKNPFSYKECEQLQTKNKVYRQATCLSWLIIYKILAAEILILSIIHGARHPSKIKKLRKIK